MTRPWHSSRLLRIGLVGLFLLLAAWPLSFYRWGNCRASTTLGGRYIGSGLTVADGDLDFWVGRPYQILGITFWSGFELNHWQPNRNPTVSLGVSKEAFDVHKGEWLLGKTTRVFETPFASAEWQAPDRLGIHVKFWVIVLIYVAFLASASGGGRGEKSGSRHPARRRYASNRQIRNHRESVRISILVAAPVKVSFIGMLSRIRLPKPILPVALIVIGVTCLCSIIRKSFQESDREEAGSLARNTIPNVPSDKEYDPFADPPMNPPEFDPNNPKIKVKFVESGSGTEELAFDWIVTPFSCENENDSSEN